MPAGPPYGNKNAEKWNFIKAARFFYQAIELANEKEGGVYKYDFIGEVARDMKSYKTVFSVLSAKYPPLKRLHTRLIETVESNCFFNAKKGNIREATAIVNLKSNHQWTDRIDNSHTITDKRKTIDELFPDDGELIEGK